MLDPPLTPDWHPPLSSEGAMAELLPMGELHLWQAPLEPLFIVWERARPQIWSILQPDERERAERFVQAHHRQRFVLSRLILRCLLSHYTGQLAAAINFTYGLQGKPQHPQLEFNLAHSQNLALYAFGLAQQGPIGIDVEQVRPVPYWQQISQRYFSPPEQASLAQAEEQLLHFFRLWTCKEAYLKATGAGLSQLQQIMVISANTNAWQLCPLSTEHQTDLQNPPPPWHLLEFCPAPGYQAALAYVSQPSLMQFWQIDSDWLEQQVYLQVEKQAQVAARKQTGQGK